MNRTTAIKKSIKLWVWLARTGKDKDDFDEDFPFEYLFSNKNGCYLCELYHNESLHCNNLCPLKRGTHPCYSVKEVFAKWGGADTELERKFYAMKIVNKLKNALVEG